MRIYRSGRTEPFSDETDSRSAVELADDWRPGTTLWFDATRDKSGARHSAVGIELVPEDIAALCDALLSIEGPYVSQAQARVLKLARRKARSERIARRKQAALALEAVTRLDAALSDIHNLVALRDGDVPPDQMLEQVYTITRDALFDDENHRRKI
jgi:hypothetical protein